MKATSPASRSKLRCAPKPPLTTAIWPAAACCLLAACAAPKSRLLAEPSPSRDPEFQWAARASDGVSIALHQVIVRNSAGSWLRDADWDEYVLEVSNESPQPIRIDYFELYGADLSVGTPGKCHGDGTTACPPSAGAESAVPQESTTSRERLQQGTTTTLRVAKDAGIVLGAGLVPLGAAVAIMGTGGTFLAASGATVAAAAGAVIVAPIAVTVATVHVVRRHKRDKQDEVLVDRRLAERGFVAPVEVAAETRVEKSIFFPITPAPTRIGIRYELAGDSRELWLSLPKLAALHLKTASPIDSRDSRQTRSVAETVGGGH